MPAKLILNEVADGLQITGMTDVDKDMEMVVGTEQPGVAIEMHVKEAADKLHGAIRKAAASGRLVMSGLVAFTQPIFVKGASLNLQRAGKSFPDPKMTKIATANQPPASSEPAYTVDDSAVKALYQALSALNTGPEHIKQAAPAFIDYLVEQIDKEKVDGKEIGFNVPVKVAFRDAATRDLFLNWHKKPEKKAAMPIDELLKSASAAEIDVESVAKVLVKLGAVRSSLSKLI